VINYICIRIDRAFEGFNMCCPTCGEFIEMHDAEEEEKGERKTKNKKKVRVRRRNR